MTKSWGGAGGGVTKKPPVVRAALCTYLGVCYFFTLTVAILTETRSSIIRTTITMRIRERLKSELILA
jgi:hypothetical protein